MAEGPEPELELRGLARQWGVLRLRLPREAGDVAPRSVVVAHPVPVVLDEVLVLGRVHGGNHVDRRPGSLDQSHLVELGGQVEAVVGCGLSSRRVDELHREGVLRARLEPRRQDEARLVGHEAAALDAGEAGHAVRGRVQHVLARVGLYEEGQSALDAQLHLGGGRLIVVVRDVRRREHEARRSNAAGQVFVDEVVGAIRRVTSQSGVTDRRRHVVPVAVHVARVVDHKIHIWRRVEERWPSYIAKILELPRRG
mmetsp:Transcript_66101/g.193876  ORF Transcript_66101/g.193876 Transcript_66101/m.193876 type:complete len:254 (+) Transcript_66101:3317-4078(+)